MSKYTRLNKINHFHDSGSNSASLPTLATITKAPIKSVQARRPKVSINSSQLKFYINNIMNEEDFNNVKPARSSTKMNYYSHSRQLKLAFIVFISIFMLLVIFINGAYSLNCYHCSSVDNPGCDEAFTGRANITDTDCEKHIGRSAKVCRKIVQYIEHKKVVIRSCGFIDEHEEKDRKSMCFKRSGTFAIMMESCICYEDNCNHSATLVPNRNVLSLLASCSLVIFYYISIGRTNRQSIIGYTSR